MRGRATTAVTAAVSDSSVSPASASSTTVAVNAEPSLRRRRPGASFTTIPERAIVERDVPLSTVVSDWHSVEGEETQVAWTAALTFSSSSNELVTSAAQSSAET